MHENTSLINLQPEVLNLVSPIRPQGPDQSHRMGTPSIQGQPRAGRIPVAQLVRTYSCRLYDCMQGIIL